MKYLRLFESKVDLKLWEEIEYREWAILVDRSINFTENETEEVRNLSSTMGYGFRNIEEVNNRHVQYEYLSFDKFDLNCLPDEWYLIWVVDQNIYLKCDQWDALLECIRNLPKIIKDAQLRSTRLI